MRELQSRVRELQSRVREIQSRVRELQSRVRELQSRVGLYNGIDCFMSVEQLGYTILLINIVYCTYVYRR